MHGNTKVFGIINVADNALRPQGSETWYLTKEARDAAIVEMRQSAQARGLSRTAAFAGIYPVAERWSEVKDAIDNWHAVLVEGEV